KRSAVDQLILHEIHTPALVRALRLRHGTSMQAHVLSTSDAHAKLQLARPDVLIMDDMGMRKLSPTEAQDLCEILEERSIGKSTLFSTKLTLDHWSEVIDDPMRAVTLFDGTLIKINDGHLA